MENKKKNSSLLSNIRGQITENAPIGRESWFGCGGAADLLFEPADFDDLATFLKLSGLQDDIAVIGGMANTIVRDGGVRGCVIRLGKQFSNIEIDGETITAGAGALSGSVAQAAAKAGLGGLEFLSGIPGCIGGAVCMNAGAYGSEVKDVLVEVMAVDRMGKMHLLKPCHPEGALATEGSQANKKGDPSGPAALQDDIKILSMSYRHTDLPEGYIITRAVFRGRMEDKDIVRGRLKDIKAKRQDTQPISEKTGGSTFANPPGHKAWELIDRAGCRGLKIGGAQMSEKHCNFMINTGNATAADLENLGEEVRRRVREKTGIELKWEIKRIGDPA